MNNYYDLLIEMLEARAQNVDHGMLVDGSAIKLVRSGDVVYLDGPGGELYIWSGLDGFNVLDTANGEPRLYPEWDYILGEIANNEDEEA